MTMPAADLSVEAPPAVASLTTQAEAARYLAASVAALSLDAAVLWVVVEAFAVPVWLAGAIAYAAGLVLIYVLSIRWVFRRRTLHNARREFIVFALLGIIGLVLNSATLSVATALGLALPLAKALSAGIGFVSNFVSRKIFLFAGPSK